MHQTVCSDCWFLILINMISVTPQAIWLCLSWSQERTSDSASFMRTTAALITQSEPYSILMAREHAIMPTVPYGERILKCSSMNADWNCSFNLGRFLLLDKMSNIQNTNSCFCVLGWIWPDQVDCVWMRREPKYAAGAGVLQGPCPPRCTPSFCPWTGALESEFWGGTKCLSPSWRVASKQRSVWVPAAPRWVFLSYLLFNPPIHTHMSLNTSTFPDTNLGIL